MPLNFNQTVLYLFDEACRRYGDKPAFTCLGETLSYADLDRLSRAFTGFVQNRTTLKPGDRIAVQLPNLLQYPVAAFGALRAGLILVNANPLYTAREMEHQFNDAGARALIIGKTMADKARQVVPATGIELVLVTDVGDFDRPGPETDRSQERETVESGACSMLAFRDVIRHGAELYTAPVTASPSDIAVLQYTGGTTGVSKGAMLSHRNLVANTLQVIERAAAHFAPAEEVYVAPLPLYHIYAFTVHCLCVLHRGGLNILIPNPRETAALIAQIKPYRFTGFVGITTLFAALCREETFPTLDFSALKSTSAGGMALCRDVAERWLSSTGVCISEGYGLTEASPVITSNPPGEIQLGTVGRPLVCTEVKVVDDEGRPLSSGEKGELWVRGPQVMLGYWQRPAETAETLTEDRWLKTGDVAVIQPDGYIRIVDRIKDMIVVSGFNVYPTEIEEVASGHPAVLECAAIAVPDPHSGEAVKLFAVPAGSVSPEELRAYLRERLVGYKVPSIVELVAELPKSNVGKILRRALR